jgi:hypothetical protein
MHEKNAAADVRKEYSGRYMKRMQRQMYEKYAAVDVWKVCSDRHCMKRMQRQILYGKYAAADIV